MTTHLTVNTTGPVIDRLELDADLTGELVLPGDADWDTARSAWNLAVDQQPEAVVVAADAADVAVALSYARERGLRIAPQGTGHNAAPMGDLSGTILLSTARMCGVTVDPDRRTARAEAGVVWGQLTAAAADHELAALAGSAADVGVVGYCLGGGLSWLARSHGLACNSVLGFDVVTADGQIRSVDADNEPELFWALRGGGGSFAVVTAIELQLLPIAEVYAAAMFWPVERAGEVLHAYRRWAADLPDAVTSCGRVLQLPPAPHIPEPLRGRAFVLVEAVVLEECHDAEQLLHPLRALAPDIDTGGRIPVAALSDLHMDPPGPVPGTGEGMLLAHLPPEAVDAIVAVAGAGSSSPLLSVEVRHLGGALSQSRQDAGALATVEAEFSLFAVGLTPDPAAVGKVRKHLELLGHRMAPWGAGRAYQNWTEHRVSPSTFHDDSTLRRLRQVKATYDAGDVIRANHPI